MIRTKLWVGLLVSLWLVPLVQAKVYSFDFDSDASYADWRSYVVETEALTSNIDGGGMILYDSWWTDRSGIVPDNFHPDIDTLVRRSDNMLQLDQGDNEYRYNILMSFPLAVPAGAGSQFRVTYKNRADVADTTFSVYGPTPHTTLDTALHLSTASATLTAQDTGWVTIPAGLTEVKVAMIMKAGVTSVSYMDDLVVEIVGPEIGVTPVDQQVFKPAGETDFQVLTDSATPVAWTAEVISGGDWLSISAGASGIDNGTITAAYACNTTGTDRTGIIRVSAPDRSGSPIDLTVTQSFANFFFNFDSDASYDAWRSYVVETETLTTYTGMVLYDSWWVDRSGIVPDNFHPDIDTLVRRDSDMLQLNQGDNEYRYNILMRFPLAVPAGAGSQFRVTFKNSDNVAVTTYSVYGPTVHFTADTTAVHLSTASATLTARDTGWVAIPAGLTEINVAMIMKAGVTSINYIDDLAVEIVGPEIAATPVNAQVFKPAGETSFQVFTDSATPVAWTAEVTSGGDWLSIATGASGIDNGTITAAYTENTTGADRAGIIRVSAPGRLGSPIDLTVTQSFANFAFNFDSDASYAAWRSYVVETETLTSQVDEGGLILYDSWWTDPSNPAPANFHPDIDMLVRRSDNMLQLDQGGNEYRYNLLMSFPLAVPAGAGAQFRVTYKNRDNLAVTTYSVYGPTPHTTLDTTAVHVSTPLAALTAQDTGWVTIPAGLTEVKVAMIMKAGTYSINYIDDLAVEINLGTTVVVIPGDANGDGMVDVGDLGILAANYGRDLWVDGVDPSLWWSCGDFNNDGVVDVGDLGILAAHYGEGTDAAVDFATDYAKAFGTTIADEDTAAEIPSTSLCSGLGLPLIAGLFLACLGLLGGSKWDD